MDIDKRLINREHCPLALFDIEQDNIHNINLHNLLDLLEVNILLK